MRELKRTLSSDGTSKVLWVLEDGAQIESVVLPRGSRGTLCVSSQAGCAMACGFCFTGIQGLKRNLSSTEILNQVERLETEFPITNLVFMGMGEPLHNFDAVVKSCQTLLNREHRPFSRRKIMISTSGIVPAISKLSEHAPVRLAVSLNGSNDRSRGQLMPINRRWGIRELLNATEEHAEKVRMPAMLEYVLIRDVNDSLENAEELSNLIRGRPFQLNLIPFNEFPESEFQRPSLLRVKGFQHHLVSQGLTATVRFSGGNDILAACGQLTAQREPAHA